MTLLEKIRCRSIWRDERGLRVVCSAKDFTHYRWVGLGSKRKLVGYKSAVGPCDVVHVHTMPLGPPSRCLTFKLATFMRRFAPTGRSHRGPW